MIRGVSSGLALGFRSAAEPQEGHGRLGCAAGCFIVGIVGLSPPGPHDLLLAEIRVAGKDFGE
jgi:hypothetical protein